MRAVHGLPLAAALALSGLATAALAQSSLPNGASALSETYGDWQIACQVVEPPRDGPDAKAPAKRLCALAQVQREQKSHMLVFSAEIRVPDPKSDKVAATFVLPFGIAVTEPIALKADGKDLAPLKVTTCLPVGCGVPAVPVEAAAVAALAGGKPLTVATRDTAGRGISFELRPDGFAEGLKRLRALEATPN